MCHHKLSSAYPNRSQAHSRANYFYFYPYLYLSHKFNFSLSRPYHQHPRQLKNRLDSQNGSALIGLLILLPLFALSYYLFMGQMGHIKINKSSRNHCRIGLLKIQSSVADQTQSLLQLNQPMKRLQQANLVAKTLMLTPSTYGYGKVLNDITQTLGRALKAKQTALLAQILMIKTGGIVKSINHIKKAINKSNNLVNSYNIQWIRPKSMSFTHPVRISNPGQFFRQYELSPNIEQSQKVALEWKVQARQTAEVNKWISPNGSSNLKNDHLSIMNGCSATLIKASESSLAAESIIKPLLSADKSLSNSFYFF